MGNTYTAVDTADAILKAAREFLDNTAGNRYAVFQRAMIDNILFDEYLHDQTDEDVAWVSLRLKGLACEGV